MRREGSLEEFSDGRLFQRTDMVRANCMDCIGCSDCCKGMGNTVQLDPLDVHRLRCETGKELQQLTQVRRKKCMLLFKYAGKMQYT